MSPRIENPTTLRSDEAFARYAGRYAELRREPDAEDVAHAIVRKHCAGRQGRVDGAAILQSLNADPDSNIDSNLAVRCLLSSIAPHECVLLVTRCGVKPQALARHVRAKPVRREALVRFLNQFAAKR